MRSLRFTATLALTLVAVSLSAAEPAVPPAAASRTIVLVRHGAYVAVPGGSSPGPGLSPIGVAQANLVGARLAGMPAFDAVFSSPLTRAQETARVIAATVPSMKVEVLPDLAECTPPTRRTEAVTDETPEKMSACVAQLNGLFATRFVPARATPKRELLVCHGNVIRYLVTKALGVDTAAWLEMSIGHASITQIVVEPDGRFRVMSVGDVGHIPTNLQTGAITMGEKSLAVPK